MVWEGLLLALRGIKVSADLRMFQEIPCHCYCSALNLQTSSHFHGLQDRQMHGGRFSCRLSPPKPYPVAVIIAPVANPASPQRQIIHLLQGFAPERFCWGQMNQTVERQHCGQRTRFPFHQTDPSKEPCTHSSAPRLRQNFCLKAQWQLANRFQRICPTSFFDVFDTSPGTGCTAIPQRRERARTTSSSPSSSPRILLIHLGVQARV